MKESDVFVTRTEVARQLGISAYRMRELIAAGHLELVKPMGCRRGRIRKRDLDRLKQQSEQLFEEAK